MQVTANAAVNQVAKSVTSTETPSVKPNGSDDGQPMSFAEFEQRLDNKPGVEDEAVAPESQPLAAEQPVQPLQPSAEELAQQIEQFLVQAGSPKEAAPQDAASTAEPLPAVIAGQVELVGQNLPAVPGSTVLQGQLPGGLQQKVMAAGKPVSLSQGAQQLAGEALSLVKEASSLAGEVMSQAKAAVPDGNNAMPATKDLLASVDSALVEKLATSSLVTPSLHVHNAMQSNTNMLTQAAVASSPASASANTATQQLQASVDVTQPEWGRDLVEQLRSRLQLSKTDQIQHAHVRLDPPELGRLEVNLRLDGDKVSVHFTAAHPQLREALAANADRLRFDFDGSQMQLADVSVSSGLYQQSRQQSGADDEPGVMANHVVAPQEEAAPMSVPDTGGRYEAMV